MMTITTNYMRAITAIIISLTLCACTKTKETVEPIITKETVEPIITKEPITIINIDQQFIDATFPANEWDSVEGEGVKLDQALAKATEYSTITYNKTDLYNTYESARHLIIEDVVNNTVTTKILKKRSYTTNGRIQSKFNSLLSKASKDPVIGALESLVNAFDDRVDKSKYSSSEVIGFVLHIITIGDKQYLYGYLVQYGDYGKNPWSFIESGTQNLVNVVDRGYSNSTEAKAAFEAYKKLQSPTQALS